jgi:hypothetical protein
MTHRMSIKLYHNSCLELYIPTTYIHKFIPPKDLNKYFRTIYFTPLNDTIICTEFCYYHKFIYRQENLLYIDIAYTSDGDPFINNRSFIKNKCKIIMSRV